MAKLDNTHQTIENIEGARVEEINVNMFKQYVGQAIDLKLGGAAPISSSMFDEE